MTWRANFSSAGQVRIGLNSHSHAVLPKGDSHLMYNLFARIICDQFLAVNDHIPVHFMRWVQIMTVSDGHLPCDLSEWHPTKASPHGWKHDGIDFRFVLDIMPIDSQQGRPSGAVNIIGAND